MEGFQIPRKNKTLACHGLEENRFLEYFFIIVNFPRLRDKKKSNLCSLWRRLVFQNCVWPKMCGKFDWTSGQTQIYWFKPKLAEPSVSSCKEGPEGFSWCSTEQLFFRDDHWFDWDLCSLCLGEKKDKRRKFSFNIFTWPPASTCQYF